MGRLPPNVRIGLALILFGILWLTGWKLWQVSHIWVPLEIPISLSQGHVRTPAFTVNTPGSYLVRIFVPWTPEFDKGPCFIQSRCPDTTAFPVSWSLSDGRRIVARNDGDGGNGYEWGIDSSVRELGTFTVEKGEYFLDVGISQDGSRLNAGSPRLVVVKNGNGQTYVEEQFVHASGLSVVCFIVAGFLIFHPAIMLRREKRVRIARDFSLTLLGPQTREIQWDPSVTCTQAANPALHRLPSFQFGLFLIIAPLAAYASLHQWVATRTFVPVDIPVSLKPGHIRTGPFRVNLVDSFSVSLNIADQPDNANCKFDFLHNRWTLYTNGKVVAEGLVFGDFESKHGVHEIDVEVFTDGSCLDSAHPSLTVSTSRYDYDALVSLASWICTLTTSVGLSLLLIAGRHRSNQLIPAAGSVEQRPAISTNVHGTKVQWTPQPSRRNPFTGMPSFGFMAGNILLFMTLIMMVLKGNENPVPVGLRVRLLRPGTRFQSISGMQAVLVQMKSEANNLPPDIYLGSRRVPWDDFEATLQTEINRRPPDWPVYLEGDRESDWASVVRAIDRIRGLHVDVILLTHKRDSSGPQK